MVPATESNSSHEDGGMSTHSAPTFKAGIFVALSQFCSSTGTQPRIEQTVKSATESKRKERTTFRWRRSSIAVFQSEAFCVTDRLDDNSAGCIKTSVLFILAFLFWSTACTCLYLAAAISYLQHCGACSFSLSDSRHKLLKAPHLWHKCTSWP